MFNPDKGISLTTQPSGPPSSPLGFTAIAFNGSSTGSATGSWAVTDYNAGNGLDMGSIGLFPMLSGQQSQGLQDQQLKYSTVARSTTATHSRWEVNFSLTHNTQGGGWIVQHIVADFANSRACNGSGHCDYWEAWPVAPNSHVPSIIGFEPSNNTTYSDMFAGASGTHMRGSARFYEGLTLPSSFHQMDHFPSGQLLTTTTDPHLSTQNATRPMVRWWSVP